MKFVTLQKVHSQDVHECNTLRNALRALDLLGMHMNSAIVLENGANLMLYYEAKTDIGRVKAWPISNISKEHFQGDLTLILKNIFSPFVLGNCALRCIYSVQPTVARVNEAHTYTEYDVDLIMYFPLTDENGTSLRGTLGAEADSTREVRATHFCLD